MQERNDCREEGIEDKEGLKRKRWIEGNEVLKEKKDGKKERITGKEGLTERKNFKKGKIEGEV